MITRKRFNKERLLSGTLLETLLLFLFILLAITSIYQKIIKDGEFLLPGHVQLDEDEYKQIKDGEFLLPGHVQLDEDEYKQLVNRMNELEEENENFREWMAEKGIMPPPCILSNKNQILFQIDYAPDTTYIMKVVNINKPFIINNKWTLTNGQRLVLKHNEFEELGLLLHESQRIDPNNADCDRNVDGAWSSANCYHCVYVVKVANLSNESFVKQAFSNLMMNKEVQKFMESRLRQYYMIL